MTPGSGQLPDPLLRFRDEFPILARTNYLVSNSLGPMPRTVPDRLAEYARDWGEHGVRAWARDWWERPVRIGDEIAPLIGAAAGEVVMMPNVSIAQSAIVSALDYPADRDTIVMTELDFPSVRYAVEQLAVRLGARVVVVPSDDGLTVDTERLNAAIDERTRLVAISHVAFRSSYIFHADALCRHAHRMGALVSLDAFHSVGVIPVDVGVSGVDFLTGGVLKWLCGGPGACFLYVAPGVRDRFAPAITGWVAHSRPFAFEGEMEYAESPFRWLNGTPAIPALYAATEGVRIVREAGVSAIREKSMRMTARLISMADDRGYTVNAPRNPEVRAGTVAIDVPHGYEIAQHLISKEIIVDYRVGAGIRVAPHFFTREDEIDQAMEAIESALQRGDWKKFLARNTVVT